MSRRRHQQGWRYRGHKRINLIPGVARANVNPLKLLRAVADGPGGVRIRDAVSWTVGLLGRASWNSRTDRYTVNTPGTGSVSRPANLRRRNRRP